MLKSAKPPPKTKKYKQTRQIQWMWSKTVHKQEKKWRSISFLLTPRSLQVPWSGLHVTVMRQAAADAAYRPASTGWTDPTHADSTASCSWPNSCIPFPFSSEETDEHLTPSHTCDFHHHSPSWPGRPFINFTILHNRTQCSAMLFHCHSDHKSFSESCDFFGREMLELTQRIYFTLSTHQFKITLI